MHIDCIEACTVESSRHFNMRVHALLTQYGNFRTCASSNIRCCHIFVDIERQFHIQARIGVVGFRLMFLIGTFRVVTQALHLPGSFCPPDTQRSAAFAEYSLPVGGNHKTVTGNRLANIMDAISKAMLCQYRFNCFTVSGSNLNHRTQFFVKQRRQAIVTQSGDIRVNATMTSKGHFRQRYQQAAIRAVVIRQQLTLCNQRLNRVIEAFQLRDVAYICRFVAKLTINLRQRRCAQRVIAFAQINQQQCVIFGRKLRRDGVTYIFHAGKCGNHQRQRRRHFALFVTFLPAGFHRHRVFTHRDRQAQSRTKFFAHSFNGFIQARIFTRVACRRHPVGGKFNAFDITNLCCGNIG